MFPIFYNLKETLIKIFSGKNLFFQVSACVVTYLIVIFGYDWSYFIYVQSVPVVRFLSPAIFIGMIFPIFGLPLLYLYAKIRRDTKLLTTIWCISQAAALGWILSSIYKAFTGRIQPPHGLVSNLVDNSHQWNFGFFEHGIFWGWPSSHTTVAFAMMFALIGLYPKNKAVFYPALLYALYIGLGVSIRIHWLSEFIAGAIIGTIVGLAVGRSFHKKLISDNK